MCLARIFCSMKYVLVVGLLCMQVYGYNATSVTEEDVIVTTNTTVIRFPKLLPNVQYYAKTNTGNQSTEGFYSSFRKLVERDPAGNVLAEFNLDNATLYTIEYLVDDSPFPIVNVNYTIAAGLAKIIFFVFKENSTYPGTNYTFSTGTVKFSLFVAGWPFQNVSNQLTLFAEIKMTSGGGMKRCETTQFPNVTATSIFCAAKEVEASISLLNFASVIPYDGLTPPKLISVGTNFTLANNKTALYEQMKTNSTFPKPKKEKCDEKTQYPIQTLVIEIIYDSFTTGALLYDPELSILLGGGNTDNGNCDDDYSVVSDPMFWLTISFIILAIICVLFTLTLVQFKYFDRKMRGIEAHRISQLRSRRLIRKVTLREESSLSTKRAEQLL